MQTDFSECHVVKSRRFFKVQSQDFSQNLVERFLFLVYLRVIMHFVEHLVKLITYERKHIYPLVA